jgi:tetratricopeptide (TPR) repeat protein
MKESGGIRVPEGALLVIHGGGPDWMFQYPRLSLEVHEAFYDALEAWRIGDYTWAEEGFRDLIEVFPEFIDVHHHLALLLDETAREEEAFHLWHDVVALGLSCLPEGFQIGRDRLVWGILENRPFLRAYHALGLEYYERGKIEKALEIFEHLLAMNPSDNQGVRGLAIDCYFRLNRPHDVLALCERFPDDGMDVVLYGRPLALFRLGREAQAEESLREAIELLPLVAEELVKAQHEEPENLRPDRVTVGGADEAYYYWMEHGGHWEDPPGALDLVRRCITETAG